MDNRQVQMNVHQRVNAHNDIVIVIIVIVNVISVSSTVIRKSWMDEENCPLTCHQLSHDCEVVDRQVEDRDPKGSCTSLPQQPCHEVIYQKQMVEMAKEVKDQLQSTHRR